jgi:hypothetical protein
VLRMVGRTQARGIFPRALGSPARIGVCPVVIGGPTVRLLAELVCVGTEQDGTGSVELTAATAFTERLRGWAAAPGRPPPAVPPGHRGVSGSTDYPGLVRDSRCPACGARRCE